MATALAVKLLNQPGSVASASGAIGRANVNIRAVAGFINDKSGEVRFITDDPEAAERALKAEGFLVRKIEVLIVPVSNTPGELALLAERLSNSGIILDGLYLSASANGEGIEVVFEAPDVAAARRALSRIMAPAV